MCPEASHRTAVRGVAAAIKAMLLVVEHNDPDHDGAHGRWGKESIKEGPLTVGSGQPRRFRHSSVRLIARAQTSEVVS
jgi:hypothetical protein